MDSHKKLFICNCFVNEALSKTVHENEFDLSLQQFLITYRTVNETASDSLHQHKFDLSLFHFFVLFGSGKDILWGKSLHI